MNDTPAKVVLDAVVIEGKGEDIAAPGVSDGFVKRKGVDWSVDGAVFFFGVHESAHESVAMRLLVAAFLVALADGVEDELGGIVGSQLSADGCLEPVRTIVAVAVSGSITRRRWRGRGRRMSARVITMSHPAPTPACTPAPDVEDVVADGVDGCLVLFLLWLGWRTVVPAANLGFFSFGGRSRARARTRTRFAEGVFFATAVANRLGFFFSFVDVDQAEFPAVLRVVLETGALFDVGDVVPASKRPLFARSALFCGVLSRSVRFRGP